MTSVMATVFSVLTASLMYDEVKNDPVSTAINLPVVFSHLNGIIQKNQIDLTKLTQ